MQVFIRRRQVRRRDPVAVGLEVFRRRNERTVRGGVTDGKQERSVVFAAAPIAEPPGRGTGDRLVIGVISRAARPALDDSRQAHAGRIDEVAKNPVQLPAGREIRRLGNLADEPFGIAVPLIGPHEVHASRKDGVVSCREKRVRKRRDIAAEVAFVVPQTQFVGMAAGHERHAARAAQRVGAVRVGKARTFCSEAVQIRGFGSPVSGTGHDPRVMLIAHDEQNVGRPAR